MSDIRGIPRRSKTAVVVVLVVFLQMLALAVVGMGAIKEDRVRGRQQRLDQNEDEARAKLAELRGRMLKEVDRRLHADLTAAEGPDASNVQPLVRRIFHFQSASSIAAALVGDERFYLWQSQAEKRKTLVLREKVPGPWMAINEQIRRGKGSARTRFEDHLKGVQRFPLLLIKNPSTGLVNHPQAVAWADNLFRPLGLFEQLREGRQSNPAELRRAIFHALSVYALNLDRPELDRAGRLMVKQLRRLVLEQVGAIPVSKQEGIVDDVGVFLEHVDFLQSSERRRHLLSFYTAGRRVLDETLSLEPFVRRAGPELFAMKRKGTGGAFRVGLLDPRVLHDVLESQVDVGVFRRLGMEAGLKSDATAAADDPNLIEVQALASGQMHLPFELQRFKGVDVVGEGEGRSEVWYMLIMALALLGLLFGGLILFRLWRREVRLAQLKADFVSNLSHELKTPLTSISLFTEMLREGKFDDAPADRQEAFEVLDQEAQRLQRIVTRMIETARNEAQGVPHNLMVGDLNRPILEAANRFRRIVTEPGLDLRITLAAEPLPMMLDPSAMDDAVTNLLSNAWKYKRGDAAQISVETLRRGRHAEVVVTDDGIGIPRTERKRVFETFYRAEQYLTQPVQGTGLGLALVRTIARAHKGRVRLEPSPDGHGTRFRLRFPLSRKVAAMWAARPADPEQNDPAPDTDQVSGAAGNTGAMA